MIIQNNGGSTVKRLFDHTRSTHSPPLNRAIDAGSAGNHRVTTSLSDDRMLGSLDTMILGDNDLSGCDRLTHVAQAMLRDVNQ